MIIYIKEEPLTHANMLINSTELIDIGLFISESIIERDAEDLIYIIMIMTYNLFF